MSNRRTQKPPSDPEGSHPVYSDFSYLGSSVGNLVFAVGLREDPEIAQEVINRILPMKKTVPKPIFERRTPIATVTKTVVEEACSRADCALKRERLQEIKGENENLRAQLKTIENRVIASRNKLSIMEKTIAVTEEKNESVQGMIDETQARISALEVEVSRGEVNNEGLRSKLAVLQKEIETLKHQTEENNTAMQNMSNKAIQKVIFSNKRSEQLYGEDLAMSKAVSDLGYGGNNNDSDDEN